MFSSILVFKRKLRVVFLVFQKTTTPDIESNIYIYIYTYIYIESHDNKQHKYFDLRRSYFVSDLNKILFFEHDIAYIYINIFLEIVDIKIAIWKQYFVQAFPFSMLPLFHP